MLDALADLPAFSFLNEFHDERAQALLAFIFICENEGIYLTDNASNLELDEFLDYKYASQLIHEGDLHTVFILVPVGLLPADDPAAGYGGLEDEDGYDPMTDFRCIGSVSFFQSKKYAHWSLVVSNHPVINLCVSDAGYPFDVAFAR